MTRDIAWKTLPEEHDYPAAKAYLELLFAPPAVATIMKQFLTAGPSAHKAKDILRASGLEALDKTNKHVAKDIEKIEAGTKLSPILLVRDHRTSHVIIADGYHRLCAVYLYDEDVKIPCKIV